jgi:hypothetical protein
LRTQKLVAVLEKVAEKEKEVSAIFRESGDWGRAWELEQLGKTF